jgi:hypothetical protein
MQFMFQYPETNGTDTDLRFLETVGHNYIHQRSL